MTPETMQAAIFAACPGPKGGPDAQGSQPGRDVGLAQE
jgi:hypothetical protein